jgi:hypothetical protein
MIFLGYLSWMGETEDAMRRDTPERLLFFKKKILAIF